jgi:signal transduction histidine kinase
LSIRILPPLLLSRRPSRQSASENRAVINLRPADGARTLALAIVYVIAARVGLTLGAVSGFATLVWPASGIALAAVVLWGYRVWPGIFLGAAVVNMLVGAPLLVGVGIGIGNTLEALLGAYILLRVPDLSISLERGRDVFMLIIAAAVSALVGATVGVGTLSSAGLVQGGLGFETWRAWWIGDAVGDIVFAPLILVWSRGGVRMLPPARLLELGAMIAAMLGVGFLTFFGPTRGTNAFPPYMMFPIGIWAALRFGPRGAMSAVLIASIGAVWGTVTRRGPFVHTEISESLLSLQLFTGVVATTFLVLAATIAERRRAEEEAREAHAVAAEANRAKSEFLAVMSHELRTPLHAISGYVELLTIGAQGPLSDGQLDSLSRIQRNQQHLHSVIMDILSFARLEAGKIEVQPVMMRAIEAIDGVEPLIQPELRRKQLLFERHPCPPDLRIVADPEKLRQILLNFLTNAAKYTDVGGNIAVGVEVSNGNATIWVKDSGIGIPAEQLARVFEPFYQVERGRTRRYSGIGLGLTIARDLARAMQGDVTIESEPGRGTRVAVRLPTSS